MERILLGKRPREIFGGQGIVRGMVQGGDFREEFFVREEGNFLQSGERFLQIGYQK